MHLTEPPLGSAAWLKQVLRTPPVRTLKGRTKSTQYHHIWSANLQRCVGAQGRNEAIAVLALDYLANLKHVENFKEQPFRCNLEEFGFEIVPDFLAVTCDGQVFVIERKVCRFLTAEIEINLDRNRRLFKNFGLQYVCWTDKSPLTHPVSHNLLKMRQFSLSVHAEPKDRLTQHIARVRSSDVEKLMQEGFDYSTILASAWTGNVFFDIREHLSPATVIRERDQVGIRATLLGGVADEYAWWNSLLSTCEGAL